MTRPERPTPGRTLSEVWGAWRRLAPFFRPARGALVLLVALSVLAGLVEATLMALIATMAVSIAEGGPTISLTLGPLSVETRRATMFALAIGLALVRAGLQLLLARLPATMSARVLSDLRLQLFESFTASAWSVKARERDGAFQTLMTQNVTSTAHGVIGLSTGLTAAIMFLVMAAAALAQSALAAGVFMATALLLFLVLRPLSGRLRQHAKTLSEEGMSFTNVVQEVVQVAEETEVFGSTPSYRARFHDQVEAVRRPHARTRFWAVGLPGLYQSVALLLLVVSLVVVALSGVTRLAALAAVVLLLVRALTYAQQVQAALSNIDERVPFMHQIVDALDRYRAAPQRTGEQALDTVASIGLREVSFAYASGREVLHDVSFEVQAGEAIGIVGPSGAGKSSIVQVLLRLRDPSSGELLVNGGDADRVRREDWQRRVSYVPQTSQVITGTVRDNIRFHREWVSEEDVVAAARRAHIHDDIMSLPQGYNTVIGPRADAVSGGQRQRIALARALAGRPGVLVLDEPTSALDVRSEELVQTTLQEIKADTIIVLVAHRLSTLAVCDWVVVLVEGRVSAIGSRADLMERSEFFREVHEITQRGVEQ